MARVKAHHQPAIGTRVVGAIALAVPAAPSLLLTTSTALATCTVSSTTMTCFGDESAGIVVRRDDFDPSIQNLNIDNLTRTIGGTGVELEGDGVPGSNGGGNIGRGHSGDPGQSGLDLNLIYDDDVIGIETTGRADEGIFVSSKAGNGGDGGEGRRDFIDPIFTRGGHGGEGGFGGSIAVSSAATISTGGTFAHGILAVSDGGDGGMGGHAQASADSRGGDGGAGGRSGVIAIVSVGKSIKTTGRQAQGIYAQSLGGAGGDGGSSSGGIWGGGGGGAGGGIANLVTVTNSSIIETTGRGAGGILAQSIGGFAGSGGGVDGGLFSFGASEQSGGNAGQVTVTNSAAITTHGNVATAIMAQSTGGGGGSANDDVGLISLGGRGSAGGDGERVTVRNSATLSTRGHNSSGIQAQSVGGGGGDAGLSIGLVSVGASGGSGGNGGDVTVENSGGVSTLGNHSDTILAQSVGGGGGNGGSAGAVLAAIGGSGGLGGDGRTVVVDNSGDLSTEGHQSNALLAQSIGGGGGKGGSTVDVGVFVSVGIGGRGGEGGDGGAVEINRGVGANSAATAISTTGGHSGGVTGQSVGGGGGKGGWTVSASLGFVGDVSIGIGGSGAEGGDGNDVTVHNKGTVSTAGKFSDGILAQSTGGGGGLGGFDVAASISTSAGLAVGVGGGGGRGGNSGVVELNSWTDVSTGGNHSNGILAQSVAGGGGHGGFSVDLAASADASVGISVGGSGGSGGDASTTTLNSVGDVSTDGNHANAVLAQSIGGGGGNGGFSLALAASESFNVSVSVGGRGGRGGDASAVTANSEGNLATKGSHSSALMAQSIGGGGGNGGFSISLSGSGAGADVPVTVGGDGGIGGTAGAVTATNRGNISTEGDHSYGILAQSLAGGGGNGGFSISGSLAIGSGAGIPVSVGGGGGDGQIASAVTVDNVGHIRTGTADKGRHSSGILAQSIGGGGGNAGFSVSAGVVTGEDGGNIGVSVGGKGGLGSHGGTVAVTSQGDISTILAGSPGIHAQSIGGGGGNGGFSATFDGSQHGNIGVSVGGAGGPGNDGSQVTVDNSGKIVTTGRQSYGISAQSVGGGGGNGGFSLAGSISKATNVTVSVGGSGGGGGDGGEVEVKQSGSISTGGNSAHAVLAQSIGNSGGAGGFAGDANIALREGGDIGVAVGGGGGDGGSAGSVTVETGGGDILTKGRGAIGILAQSTGGSGGSGGFGLTANLGTGRKTVNIAVTVGGGGGNGGTSGDVSVTNASSVTTEKQNAHAVHVQSTAGSGGNGGMAISANLALNPKSPSLNLGVSVGGGGGSGNVAGKAAIDNDGGVHTKGFKSKGLYAQSIGGGGDGGLAFSGNLAGGQDSKEINVAVGGKGGSGNNADTVTVTNDGAILTEGHFSEGILAHSVGGGGGSGGTAAVAALSRQGKGTSIDIGVSVGGSGGSAGDGKAVDVTNNGAVMTKGVGSTAIDAQSIGGGGGKGGSSFAGIAGLTQSGQPRSRTVNINVSVGGSGGSGGDADTVTVTNTGDVYTTDGSSKGISAQSVGGGGGTGGAADAFSMLVGRCAVCGQKAPDNGARKISLNVSIGGSGGGGGNADAVTVDNSGSIMTEGAGSDGIFAQSIGGGGGDGGTGALGLKPLIGLTGVIIADGAIILDPAKAVKFWNNIQVAIGGSGGAGGNGGKVQVDNSGAITTLGDQSTAIYAQSVGGGGGRGGASAGGAFAITSIGAKGASGGDAETVTVKNDGDIFTTGRASMGIFAQSIGGGGGHGGDVSQNLFWPGVDVGIGIDLSLGGGSGGNGADVKVDNTGMIVTEGAGGHGIFAQSVGGGGGAAGSAGLSPGSALFFIGSTGDDGDAGKVEVVSRGDIYTVGEGAAGIFAQSGSGREKRDSTNDFAQGATGTGKEVDVTVGATVDTSGINSKGVIAQSIGVNNNSDITVTVESGGAVLGGVDTDGKGNSSDAVGIQLLDGKDNRIANMGFVSTQLGHLGTAIASRTTRANQTTVNDTVENYDTITGSIVLRGVTNSVTNYFGGRLNMGSDIHVGSGNFVTSFGTVSPGDKDQVFTSTITGNYIQVGTGDYEVDVDFKVADENPGPGVPGEADLIHVTGTAELDGFVTVNAVNGAYVEPDVSGRVLILTADGEYGNPTLVAHDTAVVNYQLSYDTTTTNNVYLGWTVNFAPDGLNRNETAAANYITDVVAAGEPDALTPVINALLEAPDIPTLRNYYDQLTPEAYIDNELATVLGNMRFGRSLMNCHTMDEAGRCGWIRFGGYRTERDETFQYFGFTENVLDGEAGIGGMINDNTALYFALNYARSDIDTEDLASSDGHRLQGGLGFSRFGNNGTVFSIAALGGAAWYDVERTLTLTGTPMTAEGDQKLYFGGGQVKLAHEATTGPISITPSVEAWGGYFYNSAITETGAEGANLDIEGDGDFFAAVRPALKLATESTTASGGKVSAFAQGGFTYIAYGNENFGAGLTATMQGDANAVPGFTVTSSLANWYFDGEVGFNWTAPGGTRFQLSGGAQFADDYTIYGGDAELVVPF